MASMSMRKFDRMLTAKIKRQVMSTHKHRLNVADAGISTGIDTDTLLTLLVADDEPDYDVGGDGTTPCECHTKSQIIGIDLKMAIWNVSAGGYSKFILYLDPDNNLGTIDPDSIFTNDISTVITATRKNTLAHGWKVHTASQDGHNVNFRIKRKALLRIGKMQDLDRLKLVVNTADDAKVKVWGTITTRY